MRLRRRLLRIFLNLVLFPPAFAALGYQLEEFRRRVLQFFADPTTAP